jgi:sporulation protein YlmC with PRC-barrel domain
MTPVITSAEGASDPLLIHLDQLVGAPVHDRNGRKLGHIYEMVAELRGDRYVIVEYLLGSGALLERVHLSVRGLFGLGRKEPTRIPWDEIDLSDPQKPLFVGRGQETETTGESPQTQD